MSVGPWGSQNGVRWDDGVFNSVRQVVIFYGAQVDSIQFEYDKMGTSVWSDKHGGTGGFRTNKVSTLLYSNKLIETVKLLASKKRTFLQILVIFMQVKLDYPDEYLVSVSGHYGNVVDCGPILIRSLTFESNKRKYGPFGIQQGTHFSFPLTGGKVVGFHGRCSWYLDSIGVYLMPLLQRNPSKNLATATGRITGNKEKDPSDSEVENNLKVLVNIIK